MDSDELVRSHGEGIRFLQKSEKQLLDYGAKKGFPFLYI